MPLSAAHRGSLAHFQSLLAPSWRLSGYILARPVQHRWLAAPIAQRPAEEIAANEKSPVSHGCLRFWSSDGIAGVRETAPRMPPSEPSGGVLSASGRGAAPREGRDDVVADLVALSRRPWGP